MSYATHLKHQLPVIASLGRTAWSAFRARKDSGGAVPSTPGPELHQTLAPRPAALIRDYLKHVGADPSAWGENVPAHFFPQWAMPLVARALEGLPYPLTRILNGGCKLEVLAALPRGEPIEVTTRLERIDDNGQRAILFTSIVTGTRSVPRALVCELQGVVPLAKKEGGPAKTPVCVPADAEELARWKLRSDAGLQFAMLTGDFNPVHWVGPYARALGFKNTILHGFSTMARAFEGVAKSKAAGRVQRVKSLDVRFTKPLALPAEVGLFVESNTRRGERASTSERTSQMNVFVGKARGGPAYLAGGFTLE